MRTATSIGRWAALAATAVMAALLAVPAGQARGDGMIVPVRPDLRVRGEWAVKYHHVDITVRDQVAEVSVDQAFVNLGKTDLEVEYLFPIPPGAAIDKMTLIADGKELPGRLLKADDARRIFEQIVRQKKDPALLEYVGYGLYKTSVFPLPPGKQRQVIVHYTQVCKKDRDLVEVMYPLNTEKFSAKPIEEVRVSLDIKGRNTIGPVYSPTHDLNVERPEPTRVKAVYKVKNATPDTDFQVFYQDGSGDVGATVLSYKPKADEDGYFLMLVSPKPASADDAARKVLPKDIVFVFDHSGSMSGEKISQARNSLTWILRNLNADDRFNVVSFSDSVDLLFTDKLVDANKDRIDRAVDMVERIGAAGGTNIEAALKVALDVLPTDSKRPAYVMFLTDGKPTVGDTTEKGILASVEAENKDRQARLFSLGVGYEVNARLLDRLSQDNHGVSAYVKENEALEGKVSGLYAKIKNPVMTDLSFSLGDIRTRQVYPGALGDLFDGDQIVVAGRYEGGGKADLVIRGKLLGEQRAFEYPVALDTRSTDIANAFVERIWAMRRVGYLMDEITLHGENKELVDELVRLARDYGIITPYTAFLAEEDTHLGDELYLRKEGAAAGARLRATGVSGEAAQRNAAVRGNLKSMEQAAPSARPAEPVFAGVPAPPSGAAAASGPMGRMIGNTSQYLYEKDAAEVAVNVRQVGVQTLYRRKADGNVQWYTPELAKVDVVKDTADVKTIRQFSDAYFELAAANNALENQVLATQQSGEELLLSLRGQTYRILPPEE